MEQNFKLNIPIVSVRKIIFNGKFIREKSENKSLNLILKF